MMEKKEENVIRIYRTVLTTFIVTAGVVMLTACAAGNNVKTVGGYDLDNDAFFVKTRLIMSRNEIKAYKHLPDRAARDAFIKEFWAKRDPNPDTPENEAKIEFDARVAYINRWFSERTGKHQGLDSDRGKVYLFLGPPDERTIDYETVYQLGAYITVPVENWIYHRHRLFLQFFDFKGFGEFRLSQWTPQLMTAIELEKFSIYDGTRAETGFTFKTFYDGKTFKIQLPVKELAFEEKEGKMNAVFKITVDVYQNNKKVDETEMTQEVSEPKETILKKDVLELRLPYAPTLKGKVSFDIIVKELSSNTSYKRLLHHKF
jgi:GWxTD domain-containing protein